MAGILKKAKEGIDKDLKALAKNKKIKVDQEELKKKLDKANKKKEAEIDALKIEDSIQKRDDSQYHARVRLFITSGSKREEIADLGAFFGHKEGKQTLKVINKDKEVIFEQIKPDWQNSFDYSDEETLKTKITTIKDILKQFQNGEIQEKQDENSKMVYYEEDYVAMLRDSEQKYAIKVLGSKGTYSETVGGLEVYAFDIIGFFKIPMFYYTDKAILGIPSAPKIIIGQYIIDVLFKDFKSDETKAERIVLVIAAVCALCVVIAGCWMLWSASGDNVLISNNLEKVTRHLQSITNFTTGLDNIVEGINTTNELLINQNPPPVQDLTQVIK